MAHNYKPATKMMVCEILEVLLKKYPNPDRLLWDAESIDSVFEGVWQLHRHDIANELSGSVIAKEILAGLGIEG